MMSWRWIAVVAVVGAVGRPAGVSAQSPAQTFAPRKEKVDQKLIVPKAYLPPAGMCRIWLDDVPPAQQPAPTDCATAIKNRPTKGRVVFGDDGLRKDREKDDKGKSRKP